jgi:hypothetical protein
MQPYSELANWDGSLEDVDNSVGPPSPSDTPSSLSLAHSDPLMYHQYHNQVWIFSHAPLPLFESR